jgi:hypothetical protein
MPKGKGYGKGVTKAAMERKGGGSAKAGRQASSQSGIGDGRAGGRSTAFGSGQKPTAAGSSAMRRKNDVQY